MGLRKPRGVECTMSQVYAFIPLLVFVVNGAVALYMVRRLRSRQPALDD